MREPKTPKKPGTRSTEAELEAFLLSAHRLLNAMGDSEILTKKGVGLSEWSVLSVIENRKDVPLREVLRKSSISRQRVRKVLQDLSGKKLVTISQLKEGDKRQRLVSGTAKGAEVRAAILGDLNALAQQMAVTKTGEPKSRNVAKRFFSAGRSSDRIVALLRKKDRSEDAKDGAEGGKKGRRGRRRKSEAETPKAGKSADDFWGDEK